MSKRCAQCKKYVGVIQFTQGSAVCLMCRGKRRCAKCRKIKKLMDGNWPRRPNGYWYSYCRPCRNTDERKRIRRSEWAKENPARQAYNVLKHNANQKTLALTISQQDFVSWWNSTDHRCAYCGLPEECLSDVWADAKHARNRLSIDRIDSSRGYCLDNIAFACLVCNMVKGKFFSESEMKQFIGPAIRQVIFRRHNQTTVGIESLDKIRSGFQPVARGST